MYRDIIIPLATTIKKRNEAHQVYDKRAPYKSINMNVLYKILDNLNIREHYKITQEMADQGYILISQGSYGMSVSLKVKAYKEFINYNDIILDQLI